MLTRLCLLLDSSSKLQMWTVRYYCSGLSHVSGMLAGSGCLDREELADVITLFYRQENVWKHLMHSNTCSDRSALSLCSRPMMLGRGASGTAALLAQVSRKVEVVQREVDEVLHNS